VVGSTRGRLQIVRDGGKSGVRVRVRERCAVRVRKVERLYIARDDIII